MSCVIYKTAIGKINSYATFIFDKHIICGQNQNQYHSGQTCVFDTHSSFKNLWRLSIYI